MKKIKQYIKNNKYLYKIFLPLLFLKRLSQYIILTFKYQYAFCIKRSLRNKEKAFFKEYRDLKKYRNIHKGERCFIVGTGPSLSVDDLNLLKNDYSFSVNSIYKAFDKTTWRPTYYLIQDSDVYRFREPEQVAKIKCEGKFYGDTLKKYAGREGQVYYPLNLLPMRNNYYNNKFSDDIYSEVIDGSSVVYSAMQIAVYMGFNEIYLIGCDCDYGQTVCHFMDDANPKHSLLAPPLNMAEIMNRSYMGARKYADSNNIEIFNATRGGKLEIFERKSLDEIF